jgi:hypothetical protein
MASDVVGAIAQQATGLVGRGGTARRVSCKRGPNHRCAGAFFATNATSLARATTRPIATETIDAMAGHALASDGAGDALDLSTMSLCTARTSARGVGTAGSLTADAIDAESTGTRAAVGTGVPKT